MNRIALVTGGGGGIGAGLPAPFFANPVVRELPGKAVPSRRLGNASNIASAAPQPPRSAFHA